MQIYLPASIAAVGSTRPKAAPTRPDFGELFDKALAKTRFSRTLQLTSPESATSHGPPAETKETRKKPLLKGLGLCAGLPTGVDCRRGFDSAGRGPNPG